MPIDWVALAGVIGGLLIVLIPILGITARFALKPIVESYRTVQGGARSAALETAHLLDRFESLETRLEVLEGDVERLGEAREFDEKLLSDGS